MPLTALIASIALLLYFYTLYRVIDARIKYKVLPPNDNGPEPFLCIQAAHRNSTEQLVLFLPSLWLFSVFVSQPIGAMLGLLWIVGRILYVRGYYRKAEDRLLGFIIALLVSLILLVGGLIGSAMDVTPYLSVNW